MQKPLLIVGLMLAAIAATIGTVVVLGSHASRDIRDITPALKVESTFPMQDLKSETKKTPVDLPAISKTGPWPKIAFDATTYAFGRMAINTHNEHTFLIRNEGEADLILKEGKTTCKCTKFSVESKVLKPGEQTKLVIDWKAGNAPERAFQHGGPIYTNDPKNAEVNFTVEGAIDMPVELLPNIWNVGNINAGQTATLRTAIVSRLTDKLEIDSIESPSGKVTAKISPMNAEDLASEKWGMGFRLDLEVAADIPAGRFEEEVKINLRGIDQVPFVMAKVTARKYGSFILQPMDGALFSPDKLVLQLGQFSASEGRHTRLLLIVDQKDMTEPLQITDIDADPPFMKAALEQLGTSSGTVHRYAVEIKVPPGRPHVQKTESKKGHITIHTNHPSKETIEMDVLMHSH